jgi:hypothetical protein
VATAGALSRIILAVVTAGALAADHRNAR